MKLIDINRQYKTELKSLKKHKGNGESNFALAVSKIYEVSYEVE